MNISLKETIVIVGYGWIGQANALALSTAGYNTYYYDTVEPELHYNEYKEAYDSVKSLPSLLEKDGPDTIYIVCVGDKVSPEGDQDISSIKKALDSVKNAQGRVVLLGNVDHDDAVRNVDLDRRQSDPRRPIHGFQHVVHDAADTVVHLGHRLCRLAQARVRKGQDVELAHRGVM